MGTKTNASWNLESFLDSLIFELDKAQDRLSVKGLNRKLTYTVKDVSLDLQIFPEFDGDMVRFTTAKPGETGASKVSFQLGSIRDSQIQEVTRRPLTRDDLSLDDVNLPELEKKELQKLGIQSVAELKRTIEDKQVDLTKVTKENVDYKGLAGLINQAHRRQTPPEVSKVSVSKAQGDTLLTLHGNNLSLSNALEQFPIAALNDERVEVVSANAQEMQLRVKKHQLQGDTHQLKIALDPYAIFTLNVKT